MVAEVIMAKNIKSKIKTADSLLKRSPLDLLTQKMLRDIKILEVRDRRRKSLKRK